MPLVKGVYRPTNEILLTSATTSALSVTKGITSNITKMVAMEKEPIAATNWLSVMEEMNIPTEINAAPKRVAPKILPMTSGHDGDAKKQNTTA